MAAGKWEVHTDDHGNLYFYNSATGESVWELPDEEKESEDQDEIQDEDDAIRNKNQVSVIKKPREQYSIYTIAVGVADAMANLVETIEENANQGKKSKSRRKFVNAAAEKRFLRSATNNDKKKKHLHDRTVSTYVNALVPKFETGGHKVGSLFTAEESRRWLQERDREREAKRRAVRRARQQHQEKVESLQRHQRMLILFRSDLMKFLLGKILCSTELQRQRILLLTTPQMLAEMKERKMEMEKNLEPEIAEKLAAQEKLNQQKHEKNIRKVFATIDETGTGKLHLLQILFVVFSKERPQKFAAKVRGLAELLRSTELQRFLIDFMSQASRKDGAGAHLITVSEFREFVTIIEEVLDHYSGVKAAVEDAENDIDATLGATSGGGGESLARARMGAMSSKKIKYELEVLKEHNAHLQAVRDQEKRRGFNLEEEFLVPPKEEWEKNHHHRLIRLEENLPVFCCLCRRRRWDLRRREQEEIESEYRSHWPNTRALRLKDEELRYTQERDSQNGIPVQELEEAKQDLDVTTTETQPAKYELTGSSDRDDDIVIAVRETLVALVMLVETTAAEEFSGQSKPHQRVHKKTATKSPKKRGKGPPHNEMEERMKIFEKEEQERKTMWTEERSMVIMLERNRRAVERPFLRGQDAAHDALVRLMEHCVNPSRFLSRLVFERCLSFVPPQNMALAVTDNSVKSRNESNRLILQTIPCRTEMTADYIFSQAITMLKTLQNPFVIEIVSVDKHLFQLFSEPGLLIECWPVVFVVSEYFDRGSWIAHYRKCFLEVSKEEVKYSTVEQHLRNVFREVASGLAAMHSLDLLHLNVNLGNIYIANNGNTQDEIIHVKISGPLSWKYDFDTTNLQSSDMHDSFNYNYAPPEAIKELPVTAKADAWMLGCALCEALFMWQGQQLKLSTPNHPIQLTQPIIFHTKSIVELLQKLPITTSPSMRSLIRMLLQPNPAQRPQMNHVVDLLCRNM